MTIDYNLLIRCNQHIFDTQSREAAVQHAVANGLYGGYQGNYDEYTPEYALSLQLQAESQVSEIDNEYEQPTVDYVEPEVYDPETPWGALGLSKIHYDEWQAFETEFYNTYYPSVELTGVDLTACNLFTN